nr:formin-like protein 14 [Aegilops tauschii subsp. strangulata]
MPPRPVIVNAPDATLLHLREDHLLPLVPSSLPAVPLTEHLNTLGNASKKGRTHTMSPLPNLRRFWVFTWAWGWGGEEGPRRRLRKKVATLAVATIEMIESSRVSRGPKPPPPAPDNALGPTAKTAPSGGGREDAVKRTSTGERRQPKTLPTTLAPSPTRWWSAGCSSHREPASLASPPNREAPSRGPPPQVQGPRQQLPVTTSPPRATAGGRPSLCCKPDQGMHLHAGGCPAPSRPYAGRRRVPLPPPSAA